MNGLRTVATVAAAVIGAGALSACAVFEKCGTAGCPGDAAISAEVRKQLDEHAELEAPNLIYIQTLDHVVYLSGQVNTEPERNLAKTVAARVPGVTRVVNNINLEFQGH